MAYIGCPIWNLIMVDHVPILRATKSHNYICGNAGLGKLKTQRQTIQKYIVYWMHFDGSDHRDHFGQSPGCCHLISPTIRA